MNYPALFNPATEGGYVVTFRDIPEAITQGDTVAKALAVLGKHPKMRMV